MTQAKITTAPAFMDDEERDLIEGFDAAIDRGDIKPQSEPELNTICDHWAAALAHTRHQLHTIA